MAHDDFLSWPEDVQELIDDIGTVEGLDVMCMVARAPTKTWRMEELSDEIATDRYALDDAVRRLLANGLIRRLGDGTLCAAVPAARHRAMSTLCELCEQDRGNVLGAIAHFSISRIRTSAVRTFVRKSGDRGGA